MAHNSGEPASTECQATPMPSKRKSPCPIMMVVLATTMEGMLSSSETVPRRSQALIASPPSAAVGVTRLNASPANRTHTSVRKGTESRRNAKRQPSVSKIITSGAGKQTRIPSRQDRRAMDAKISAG